MIEVYLFFEDGVRRSVRCQPPVLVGRRADCNVQIRHWRVGRRHAKISLIENALVLEDFGTLAGTTVNGRRIAQYAPLLVTDEVQVGPCLLRAEILAGESGDSCALALPNDAVRAADTGGRILDSGLDVLHSAAAQTGVSPPPAIWPAQMAHAYLDHTGRPADNPQAPAAASSSAGSGSVSNESAHEVRRQLHAALLQALDLRRRDVARMSDQLLRSEARRLLGELMDDDPLWRHRPDREDLWRQVLDEAVGYGPLEPLLQNPDITEIMVNRYDEIYVERAGRLYRHEAAFSSEQAVLGVIERIVAPIGRRIDESTPMVDARLPDGSRVNAVIPPVALKGAGLTIRKFPRKRLQMVDLIRCGSISPAMATFLELCVQHKKNIIVSGGTGSGKTTLLNILSNGIAAGERIVTIEDAAELRLNHVHLVALEARPANQEGRGQIDIRGLVRNALRMRPDRIVVGECRGAEAFDMLAAMNTGHEGSLTTLHANTPRDALARLETMILMAGMDLPLTAVREHVASSIDLLVQQSRLPDGRRVVTAIDEVTGIESGCIQLQTLFEFERQGAGAFCGMGLLPSFMEKWRQAGIATDGDLFWNRYDCHAASVSDDAGAGLAAATFAGRFPG